MIRASRDVDVAKAKKLILQDKIECWSGAVLDVSRLTPWHLSPPSREVLYIGTVSTGRRSRAAAGRQISSISCSRGGCLRNQITRSGNGLATRAPSALSRSRPIMPSVTSRSAAFKKVLEDCGGKIVQKIWVPLGTKDFGPYIPTIKSDADAMFTVMVGPMSLQFPKQLRGWEEIRLPIVGGGTSYDEFALPFMGDEVIGDVYGAPLQRRRTCRRRRTRNS